MSTFQRLRASCKAVKDAPVWDKAKAAETALEEALHVLETLAASHEALRSAYSGLQQRVTALELARHG